MVVKIEFLADLEDVQNELTVSFDQCKSLGAVNLRGTGFAAQDWSLSTITAAIDGQQVSAALVGDARRPPLARMPVRTFEPIRRLRKPVGCRNGSRAFATRANRVTLQRVVERRHSRSRLTCQCMMRPPTRGTSSRHPHR